MQNVVLINRLMKTVPEYFFTERYDYFMRRNCSNCGMCFEGDICPECGTPAVKQKNGKIQSAADKFLTDEQRAAAEARSQANAKDKKTLIFLLILVATGIIFIIYRNGLIGGGSYKEPIEQYFNAIIERDFDSYIKAMPPKMQEDYIAERNEMSLSGYDYLDKLYSDIFSQFGDTVQVELEFFGKSRPDEEYIRSFESSYQQAYGENINTKTVYGVLVVAHFRGDISADLELECFVLRHKGRWYVVGCDFASNE